MDGSPIAMRWLDALPVPALLVAGDRLLAHNAPAVALLGADPAAVWSILSPQAAAEASPSRATCPRADSATLELELTVGPPTDADGSRIVVLRDLAADAAARVRLERGLAFERLLTRSSADLMRSGEAQLDVAVEEVLGAVGRFFEVDRAYVFRIDEGAGTQSNTHEWTAPGISREAHNLQGVPLDSFPWLLAELRRDAVFGYASLDDLPAAARSERSEFEREGIQSILIVPLWSGEVLRGFIGFDAVRRRVEWNESYVVGLRLLAQMLAGAMDARRLSRQLRRQAMHDAVTGLPNRLYLRDRFGPGTHWGPSAIVAVIDVDDFKDVNDRHGHGAGDAVLREMGRRLAEAAGCGGVVARVGGDEFVMVQPRAEVAAPRLAARLIEAAEQPFDAGGVSCHVGISIGIVGHIDDATPLDVLLDRADAAMYRAKSAGKNRWTVAEVDAIAD